MYTQHSFHLTFANIVYFVICTTLFASSMTAATPRGDSRKVRRQDPPIPDKPCDGFFNTDYDFFLAEEVYKCLISVPFNQTAALQFLKYYESTVQLQSTLAYLKNPPEGYQQPKTDFIGALDLIKSQVNTGYFKNEYQFEVAVQKSILSTHDAHINLAYGILNVWVFASPYGLAAASKDGIELPKIYIIDDLVESSRPGVSYQASPVISINGEDTVAYLERFASEQVQGFLEPHADFNALMSSAAGDIQSLYSIFEGNAPFYPGANITFKFANGTSSDDDDGTKLSWLAQYSPYVDVSSTPNVTTGQQLFDWFILGVDSTPGASAAQAADTALAANSTSIDDAAIANATSNNTSSAANTLAWDNDAYPDADGIVSQPNLGGFDGGYVTGYILNDNVTGILSIPSFDATPGSAFTFSAAVRDFLNFTKEAGVTRVIVDLQRNTGGSDLLATDAFKQFFPQLDPYQGARQRAEPTGDAIGNTFSTFYQSKQPSEFTDPSYEDFSASIWTAPAAINVETNANFTNWQQYFGPIPYNGDQFTRVRRDNLSSAIVSEDVAGIVVYGFANSTVNTTQPYPANDVILLTDGVCSSACARFVELMRTVGGARTVVAGGRPETGPQQAVAGNKGALEYDSYSLDIDISTAVGLNQSLPSLLPHQDNVDFILTYASFNIFDNLRRGTNVPLQFQYEAADCRIFYTTWTVYNYENLWNYVIDAFYRNPSLCVAGSTNVKQAPKPTPSTVGGLIMAGLSPNSPPTQNAPSSKQKRSTSPSATQPLTPRAEEPITLPSKTLDLGPRTIFLETDRNDGPVDINVCDRCNLQQTQCLTVPNSSGGKTPPKQICARICNGLINCVNGQNCQPRFGKNGASLCVAPADFKAITQFGTGIRALADPQASRVANPSINQGEFSRGARQGAGTVRAGRG